ncbi:hypothetical protein B0H16DRAFT_1581933 [Mycena metata]|uniref:Uncharacterized protein n=1 Tax=Mycena metata TaxID=1033252 RepID=A0AAD7MV83_9AGAR|nr:hypothetical protein B0H16DRAFT_1581933 [Mycena metata]
MINFWIGNTPGFFRVIRTLLSIVKICALVTVLTCFSVPLRLHPHFRETGASAGSEETWSSSIDRLYRTSICLRFRQDAKVASSL